MAKREERRETAREGWIPTVRPREKLSKPRQARGSGGRTTDAPNRQRRSAALGEFFSRRRGRSFGRGGLFTNRAVRFSSLPSRLLLPSPRARVRSPSPSSLPGLEIRHVVLLARPTRAPSRARGSYPWTRAWRRRTPPRARLLLVVLVEPLVEVRVHVRVFLRLLQQARPVRTGVLRGEGVGGMGVEGRRGESRGRVEERSDVGFERGGARGRAARPRREASGATRRRSRVRSPPPSS